MIKKKITKVLALALASMMMLTACQMGETIPELQEPVGSAPTYRPVFKADIGVPKVIIGSVVGTDHPHYYEKIVDLKNIKVEVGQYVEKGDILAEADLESVKEMISVLNSDLSILNQQHETDEKLHEIALQRLAIARELAGNDKDALKEVEKNEEIEEENHTYQNLRYEYDKKKTNESIADYNKLLSEGYIKAKSSGYVTYIKDMKKGLRCQANENVVTVTDMEDLYISSFVDTRSYQYESYPVKFALIEGKKVPIEEIKYTDGELALSKVQNAYPTVKFRLTEEHELTPGDKIVMEFYSTDKNDVLVVGKDSYQVDDEGFFVYVRQEDGSNEKRYFEGGSSDEHFMEVVSGLEEGEMVLYSQEETLPVMDGEYEVVLKDFKSTDATKGVKYVEKQGYAYYSPDKGEVVEIYVDVLQEVKKGDPLVKLAIDAEKGALVRIENNIKKENSQYEEDTKTFDDLYDAEYKIVHDGNDSIKSMTSDLNNIKSLLESDSLDVSEIMELGEKKGQLEDAINGLAIKVKYSEIRMEEIDIQRANRKAIHESLIASYNQQLASARKENDGTGYKTIYAEFDGQVSVMSLKVGDKIDEGKKLTETVQYFDDIIKIPASAPQYFGSEFDLTYKADTFDATIIRSTPDMNPVVFSEEGKAKHISPGMSDGSFYIKVEDKEFFNHSSQFSTMDLTYYSVVVEDMINIPSDYLFKEISFDNQTYYYVWVLENGEPYKKYVITGVDSKIGGKLGSENDPVILAGLSVGDVLVK